MTYQDDHTPGAPDSQHTMITGPTHTSSALMHPREMSHALAEFHPNGEYTSPDVLQSGMDANTFYHALRRRWILALSMGVVAAAVAGIAMWIMFPESSSATMLFQINSDEDSVVFNAGRGTNLQAFELLKKTQVAYIKSLWLLNAAIRDPSLKGNAALGKARDPLLWLQNNLQVDFPNQGQILSISLTSDDLSADQRAIVDAVAAAYKGEVVFRETQRKQLNLDTLATALKKLNLEISRKTKDFYDMAKEMNSSLASDSRAEIDLLVSDIREFSRQKTMLEGQLYKYQSDYQMALEQLKDPGRLDMMRHDMEAQDPNIAYLTQMVSALTMQYMQMKQATKYSNRATSSMEKRIQQANAQLSQYKDQMKSQVAQQNMNTPDTQKQLVTKMFQIQARSVQVQLATLEQSLDKAKKDLSTKLEKSTELQAQSTELSQLQEIANDMSIKYQGLLVDKEGAKQIDQITDKAIGSENINKAEHFMIAVVGALGAFALTCFGIGYVEFRSRRLDGPRQLDEGLGIRVVGTLPALSARSAIDPNHPIVAQLTDSIDSVRTLLMHDSTSKKRQVVIVTSASQMEGRTTVASQLAASLARAGRRTLLIDGDVRRPALHALFDLPLEDGLCEVLRAEVDVADVIRPTHAEGLWVLTAGYCDVDAIHALATEQMQPVFEKLRAEYDFIIVDGAPVLGMSDALIFGQYSDGAIISARRDVSQMPKIHQAAELLRGVGVRIIGAVVNGVAAKADDRITQIRLIAPKSERVLETVG